MALIDVDWNPPKWQLRQFAALFLVFGVGIGTVLYFKGKPLVASQILWGLGVGVGVIGLILPRLVRPVYVVMMAVALPIGLVVSTVLMILIYYLVLTPIGLAARLFGYDPMRRRRDARMASYWIERQPAAQVRRYFRQF